MYINKDLLIFKGISMPPMYMYVHVLQKHQYLLCLHLLLDNAFASSPGCIEYVYMYIKQVLDEVFVISEIINVDVSVISRNSKFTSEIHIQNEVYVNLYFKLQIELLLLGLDWFFATDNNQTAVRSRALLHITTSDCC
jgi:hypothetical protein